ncbi:MAG: DUF6599 family protein [Opitutaceae bacterium]
MPTSAKRTGFYRVEIGRTEKTIGGIILLLLIGIAVAILFKGRDYDPIRFTGDVEALEFTRAAVSGKAATLRDEGDLRANEISVAGAGLNGNSNREIPVLVQNLVPMGATEFYTVDTLYEKINGRAPAYFEYNFQELRSRSFTLASNESEFVDVYLFRMDSPLNAFGIFSAERDASSPPLDFAADGYKSGTGSFMRLGNVYAQVLASSTDPEIMQAADQLTRGLVAELPEDDSGMEGRALLPRADQVPGSLTYINDNAYGQAVLNAVFEATYRVGDVGLTVFAQKSTDTETAQAKFNALRDFYSSYGTLDPGVQVDGAEVFAAEVFGQWNVIHTQDNAIIGVVNATDREAAVAFVLSLIEDRPEQTGDAEDYPY